MAIKINLKKGFIEHPHIEKYNFLQNAQDNMIKNIPPMLECGAPI